MPHSKLRITNLLMARDGNRQDAKISASTRDNHARQDHYYAGHKENIGGLAG